MPEKNVTITVNAANLNLEGCLELPTVNHAVPGVVLCHPHPLYGGNMDNNVVVAVSRGLSERGIASLRFNFRGVGRSEGSFAEGVGERDDAEAALSFLLECEEIAPEHIGMVGYSFGGLVALPVGADNSLVKALAAISPVIPADFRWEKEKPQLILWGTEDVMVPLPAAEQREQMARFAQLEVVNGADHFWWGYEGQVSALVGDFLKEQLGA